MAVKGFFLFPGQGAQVLGMAKDAVEGGGRAQAMFEEASEILGFDLCEMVFNGDDETLARTENCQPALLVASLALMETLRERKSVEMTGAAGLSLGEYTALVALDVIDFADAVRLVRKRGELMEAAGRGKDTGMASIIGLDAAQVEEICKQASGAGLVVPANYNCPGQIAISGEKAGIVKASELAKEAGAKRALPLNVSAAFHSPVMEAARAGLVEALAEVPIREPELKFVNNADARVLKDPEEIRESLARQVACSVRWEQSCKLIIGGGDTRFYEVGPGSVCKGLMKRIDKEVEVVSVSSLENIEALA
jgi:[acyl-carrier-protein] S-malonyltransferase